MGSATGVSTADIRHDWTRGEVEALFALPFNDLMFRAQSLHRKYFNAGEVQISTLLSIKTGGCPEDCAYCPQAARYDTGVKAEKLMALNAVLDEARRTGAHLVIAAIDSENAASVALHRSLGFEVMSRLPEAGWKVEQWRTLVQMGVILDAAPR